MRTCGGDRGCAEDTVCIKLQWKVDNSDGRYKFEESLVLRRLGSDRFYSFPRVELVESKLACVTLK